MSILDAQRYVESMTRKEIADALKKGGHPLVPGFVLADRAEQLKKNDAAVKKLEQIAGIPAPNQDIGSKLAQYLEANMRAGEAGGRGAPNMPGQGPGEAMPTPGVPSVPSGAGGPMPGMSRMPQGGATTSGMPMAGGGLIPRYQDRGLVEEEDFMGDLAVEDDVFGPFDKQWMYGTDWLRPKSELDYALLAATGAGAAYAGVGGIPGAVGYVGRRGLMGLAPKLLKAAPNIGRNIASSVAARSPSRFGTGPLSMAMNPLRTAAGAVGSLRVPARFGGDLATAIGTPLAKMSVKGGIPGAISRAITGGVKFPAGARSVPTSLGGLQAIRRAGILGLGGYYAGYGREDMEQLAEETGLSVEEINEILGRQDRGPGQSPMGSFTSRLEEMRETAGTETEAEKNVRKAREEFAQDMRARQDTIRNILPSAEDEDRLSKGRALELISDTMGARSTDPANSGFGRIARGIREYGDQKRERDLKVEEALFNLERGAFDVEDRNRAGLAALSRAGERYDDSELQMLLSQYQAQQALDLQQAKNLTGMGLFRPQDYSSVISLLNNPLARQRFDPEALAALEQKLLQSMLGGGGMGGSLSPELIRAMQEAANEG